MKTRNLIFALAVIGIMVNACSKGTPYLEEQEKVQEEETIPASGEVLTVYASSETSKTVLDAEIHNQINWVPGDAITVFNADCTMSTVLSTEKGGATAAFTGLVPPGFGEPGCAIYPASAAVSCSGTTITYNVPAEQTYAFNSFGPGANVAVGKLLPKEGKPGDYELTFRNVSGSVKLQLSGYLNVGKVVLKTKADERLNGQFSVDADSDSPSGVATGEEITETEKEITLNCPGVGLKIEAPEMFYITLPVGVLKSGFSFTVYDKDGNKLCTKSTTKNNSINRSKAKVIPEQFIVKHDVDPDDPDPLPEHHSNTLVITKPGVYSIDCSVKGNGYDPENPGQLATIDTDKAKRAAIIWETSDGTYTTVLDQERNVRYVPSEKKIYFETFGAGLPEGFRKGNAVIALLSSDRDVSTLDGNVLWSWHIWIADNNADNMTDVQYGDYIFMDRNLGATAKDTADDAFGLLYQWGRKDPFTGWYGHGNGHATSTTWHLNGHACEIPTPDDPEHDVASLGKYPTQTTIEYATTNPRTMFMGNEPATRHWNSDNKTNLWGAKKTMYDPCPYGYKVPDEEAFSAFNTPGFAGLLPFYGWLVGDDLPGHFWPFTGIRGLNHTYAYADGSNQQSAQYWMNSAAYDEVVSGYVGSTFDMNYYGTSMKFEKGISYVHSANPVRCQKYNAEN